METKIQNYKKLQNTIIVVAVAILLYGFLPFELEIYSNSILANYTPANKSKFSFTIPAGWEKMDSDELQQYKELYIQSGNAKVKEYSGQDMNTTMKEIEGMNSPNRTIKFLIMNLLIPGIEENYVHNMFEESKDKYKWGLDNGQIKKIFHNEIAEFKGLECFYSEFELSSGMRLITYLMLDESLKNSVYQIAVIIEPNNYNKYNDDVESILESVEINSKY